MWLHKWNCALGVSHGVNADKGEMPTSGPGNRFTDHGMTRESSALLGAVAVRPRQALLQLVLPVC